MHREMSLRGPGENKASFVFFLLFKSFVVWGVEMGLLLLVVWSFALRHDLAMYPKLT